MPIEYHSRQKMALKTKNACQPRFAGVRTATEYIHACRMMTETSVTRWRSTFCKPTRLCTGDGLALEARGG